MKVKIKKIARIIGKLHEVATAVAIDSTELNLMFYNGRKIIHNTETFYIEANIKHGLDDCVVPFNRLHQLMGSYRPDDDLIIETAKNKLTIQREGDGKSKATIAFVDNAKIAPVARSKEWEDLPTDFLAAIAACRISVASKDNPNMILTNFGVFPSRVVTTDEMRVTEYNMKGGEFAQPFTVPQTVAKIIESINLKEYAIKKQSVEMRNSVYYIKFAQLSEEYPDLDRSIFDAEDIVKIDADSFTRALERSKIFASGTMTKNLFVTLSLNGRKFTIHSSNDYGANKEVGTMKSKLRDFDDMKINPAFLLEIIKRIDKKVVKFRVADNRVIFNDEKMNHVIALNV
jgi:hypothetical protein